MIYKIILKSSSSIIEQLNHILIPKFDTTLSAYSVHIVHCHSCQRNIEVQLWKVLLLVVQYYEYVVMPNTDTFLYRYRIFISRKVSILYRYIETSPYIMFTTFMKTLSKFKEVLLLWKTRKKNRNLRGLKVNRQKKFALFFLSFFLVTKQNIFVIFWRIDISEKVLIWKVWRIDIF